MVDVLTPNQRRLNMSRVRSKDTKPEMVVRKGLHARGLRFRLHRRDLPGRPDLVFPGRKAVVFVHGCFWHGHNCPMFKLPATNREFWACKIERNRVNDSMAVESLLGLGWRVMIVWECALRGRGRLSTEEAINAVVRWLNGNPPSEILSGLWDERCPPETESGIMK